MHLVGVMQQQFHDDMGRACKTAREARGLSIRELSEMSGLSHGTIGRIEHGGGCSAWVLSRLADALDETLDGLAPVTVMTNHNDEEAAE